MGNLTVQQWVTEAQNLVLSDRPEDIRRLESLLGCMQAEAADHFIEDSCWADDLPDYHGGKGTPHQRLAALRAAWQAADALHA